MHVLFHSILIAVGLWVALPSILNAWWSVPSAPAAVVELPSPQPEAGLVRSYMDACGAKLSGTKREHLASLIQHVAEQYLHSLEHRKAFYLLICLESGFMQAARSPKGAVGLTQVMPRYAAAHAKECGMHDFQSSDLEHAYLNLHVGACHFSQLLREFREVQLALAAYNAGRYSAAVRQLQAGERMNKETTGYIHRFNQLTAATEGN